jgi:hypothetical protein
MQILNISDEKKKWLMFAVVFFYLVGPVVRFYHAYLSDIFFLAGFILILLSGAKLRFSSSFYKIFLIPVVIVFISVAGKYISGYQIGMDEAANFLNYIKLFVLFVTVYSVFAHCKEPEFKKDLRNLNYIIIFFILFVSAIGILQFVNHPLADYIIKNFYHVVHKSGTDNIYEFELLNRVTSIFDSFNGMGIVLCFTLFILIYINTEIKNYWSILVLLVGITLIFLTGNRASLIILFFMTITYLIYIRKGANLKIFSVITGLFLISGIIFFFIANYLSFDNYIRFYEFKLFLQNGSIPPTLQVRLEKWQWLPAHMLSVKQALFGYTTNDFINEKIYTSPDNQYLNWLVYYGYTGVLLFIGWILYSLAVFIKNKKESLRKSRRLNNSSTFVIIYWIGLITIGLFQESFFFGRLRELFIFLLAFIAAHNTTERRIFRDNKI